MEQHVIQYQTVHFNLNGKDVERTVDVRASLTDMLRNDFRMTSVKKGCEVGECGACTVIIDGEAFNSCIYLAVWAEEKHITTLEGLLGPNGELSDIQQAFVEEAAIQCGFCTPRLYPHGLGDFGEREGVHGRGAAQAPLRTPLPLHRL